MKKAADDSGIDENGDTATLSPPASLTAQTYERLRAGIIAGQLKPGQKLKIDDLREAYGTGASPIREALSLLTSDRLVERIDQRGFRVAQVSADEFDELLKTRCWLEERALRESIARGGLDWEEGIVLAQYRLSRMSRFTDSDYLVASREWEAQHRQFHMALISACGSSILLRFCDQLYDQNIRYRQLSSRAAYAQRDINREHEEIAEAVLKRDADKAVERLLGHYRKTGHFLRSELATVKAGGDGEPRGMRS